MRPSTNITLKFEYIPERRTLPFPAIGHNFCEDELRCFSIASLLPNYLLT